MPLSPVYVTPENNDNLNPWVDFSNTNGRPRATNEASARRPPDARQHSRTSHTRSHTTGGHPLRSPSPTNEFGGFDGALERGSSLDLHETRPSLRRVINASRAGSDGEGSDGIKEDHNRDDEAQTKSDKDAEVIVHQIQPTDSLPGVALKYNISLAALRTANKLWASDSIHLREVLYIPVESIPATNAKSVPASPRPHACQRPNLPSPSLHSAPDFRTQASARMRRSASEWGVPVDSETTITHASTVQTISAGTHSTVRRVPLSELSFFPPSTTSALSPLTHARPRSGQPSPTLHRPHASHFNTIASPARVSSPSSLPFFPGGTGHGTPTFGLTSFLNGARDEIISRLSFDSARGSSDAGEVPTGEVEMELVRSSGSPEQRGSEETDWLPVESDIASELEPGSVVLDTPRKSKVIRTVQLQPSPRMEIPARAGTDKIPNRSGTNGNAHGPKLL